MNSNFNLNFSSIAFASPLEMSVGDQIKITADKSIRYPEKNIFEAVGNVVIIHGGETIYGEKASFFVNNREVEVKGNVRYMGGDLTMYGQEMNYSINSKRLTIRNARIVTSGYRVIAEWATKISSDVILATDAEYTTCLDCPESWSIYGKKIKITLRQYVHIQNALVKSNGVPILYIPYMVLPIKKGRQTGFLFPHFSLSFKNGFQYRQPFFWAISDNTDMTLIPGSMGKKGFANDLEYRHVLGESKWFEIHSLQANDRYYISPSIDSRRADPSTDADPHTDRDTPSNTHYLRYYGSYEHHFQFGNYLNHHMYFMNARETDILADYNPYITTKPMGSELPFHTFFNSKLSLADFNLEVNYNKNLIYSDPVAFDYQYVQTLPRLSVSLAPWPLFYSKIPFFYNVSLGADLNYNYFRQGHVDHDEGVHLNQNGNIERNKLIRNAHRLEANPYINWSFGRLGPVTFETKIKSENMFYQFPYESKDKRFTKRGTVFVSDAFFEIEKIYNTGYIEEIPIDQIEMNEEMIAKQREKDKADKNVRVESNNLQCTKCLEKVSDDNKFFMDSTQNNLSNSDKDYMIGGLPKLEGSYVDEKYSLVRGGYRHSIYVDLRHHYTSDQHSWGNTFFADQISERRGGVGLFDYLDSPREYKTDIETRNTLEFILNNSIFKKTPKVFDYNQDGSYVKNNFDYSSIASFNISQGVLLRTGPDKPKLVDKLTRLAVSTGFAILDWGISISDYHFYKTKKDIFTLGIGKTIEGVNVGFNFQYDNTIEPPAPPTKKFTINWAFSPLAVLALRGTYDYDLVIKEYTLATYTASYSPLNNCWKLDMTYVTSQNRGHGDFNFYFYLNFGDNIFTPLSRPGS
ncbi:MAG: LPS-assembly protein LptD [Oligoflexia bacterium]|nr:LPS-assembly protein LptD [Oligoflexia bacterium]